MSIDAQHDARPSRHFSVTVNRFRTLLIVFLTALLLLASRVEQPSSIAWAQTGPAATGAVFTVTATGDEPDATPELGRAAGRESV